MENAPPFVTRNRSISGGSMPVDALRYLKRAVRYLQKATSAHTTHLGSRLNLTTAYLYLGDYHKARATIEEARTLAPESRQVSELRALVLYGQEKEIDMWPVATGILEKVAAAGRASALYNLARLHEERGRNETAQRHWSQLLSLDKPIPAAYMRIACKRHPQKKSCMEPRLRQSYALCCFQW